MRLSKTSMLNGFAAMALVIGTSNAGWASGLTDGFNVTVFSDFSSQNSDVEGTLAVGGNLTLSGYALNQSAPHPNTAANGFDTVVGGALSFNSGTLYGNVSAGASNVTDAKVVTGSPAPLDFAAAAAKARGESSFLYTLSPTGAVTMPYSTLNLTGSGAPLEVFSITASQMSSNSGIDIANVSSGATVLINVSDDGSHHAATSSAGLFINNHAVQSAGNVLFNFADSITSVSVANSFYSSILAPNADVSGASGAFNGDLVAESYSGNNQFNVDAFDGDLPVATAATPEPGTLGLFSGVALAALGLLRKKAGIRP